MLKKHHKDLLNKIIDSGWIQGISGVMLLISVTTSFFHIDHALILVGISHVFSVIPNILQALERIRKWWIDR